MYVYLIALGHPCVAAMSQITSSHHDFGEHRRLVDHLRQRLDVLDGNCQRPGQIVSSSGCAALDELLPGGGFRSGTVVEWLSDSPGSFAGTLALMAIAEACREGGSTVVIDGNPPLYPPAAAALGIELADLILVRPQTSQDRLWALDQSLRCEAVRAVWAPVDRLDARTFRRLQLAAEQSGGLAMLLRPASVRGQPSWSDVQLLVCPCPSREGPRVLVERVRCTGRASSVPENTVELEIDEITGRLCPAANKHETYPLRSTTELATAAMDRRARGA